MWRDSRRDVRAGAARWRRKGAGKGMTGGASRSDTAVMENAADARAQVAGRRGGRAGSGERWLAGLVATLACGPGGRGAHGGHGAGRWAERNRPRTGLARGEGKEEKGWAISWAAWAEVGRREREKGLRAGLVWVLGCYGFGFEFCFGFFFLFLLFYF